MTKGQMKQELGTRARRAMISYAIFRWESAAIIGLTLLLIILYPDPFPWWRWYYWLMLGAVSEALIIYTSLTDERTAAQVVENMFREEHNPRQIRHSRYREQFERALDYQARIGKAIRDVPSGILRDRLKRADRGVHDWLSQIYLLARRLDRFEGNEVVTADLKSVPVELRNLEARLKLEDSPSVRDELKQAIERKRTQLANLQELQNVMEGAQVRLDATLTALGTVYSQVLLLGAKGDEGAASEGLAEDIADQIRSLQDVIETMDEVLEY